MANKNTKQKRKLSRKSCRTGAKEVISMNHKRNMQMFVAQWKDTETGIGQSKTVHCKINSSKPAHAKPRRDIGDAKSRLAMYELERLKKQQEEEK